MELFNDTSTEEWRHQCEVRWCLKERTLRGVEWLRQYLVKGAVQERRQKLEADIYEQWKKGNRGEHGMWF